MNNLVARNTILEFEDRVRELPQLNIEVKHSFGPGIYMRELLIPKGTAGTGKIHKYGHMNIILKGDILVYTEDGPEHLIGPCTFFSKPGTKRALYTNEDTIWITVHPTDETSIAILEATLVVDTYDQLMETKIKRIA